MKQKLFAFVTITFLVLVGCSQLTEKTAKDIGNGMSVQIDESYNIMHISFTKYVNGREVFSENVINADNSAFEKGQVIIFDESPAATDSDSNVQVALSYSKNLDGTDAETTEKIDINGADKWVNLKFDKNYKLQLVEKDEK